MMNINKIARIFEKIPTLYTQRLTLRRMMTSDYRDMYEYACMPEVTRYLLWNPHPNTDYTYRYLDEVRKQYRSGSFFDWAITLTDCGKMIGTCGFSSIDAENLKAEIGYVINPRYRGHGIAPEAVRAVLGFGFSELGFVRIEAHYMVDNGASRRVMEKCAMTYEGTFRDYLLVKGKSEDIGICAVLKEEYESAYPVPQYKIAPKRIFFKNTRI